MFRTKQARRHSSMTGGGGGGEGRKNIWGAQINFTLIFGREDQKNKNKGLHPGLLPFFGAQVSLGGRARSMPGRARRNLMVRISLLAHKFRGKGQKKDLQREILGSLLSFTRVFRPGTKFYSRWGGTGPKTHSGGTRPVTFFQDTILAWGGARFSLRGHKQWFGGHGPKMSPLEARVWNKTASILTWPTL